MMKTIGHYLNRAAAVKIVHYGTETEFEECTKQDTGFWKLEYKTLNSGIERCPACGKYCEDLSTHQDCKYNDTLTNEDLCYRINVAFQEREYVTFIPQ